MALLEDPLLIAEPPEVAEHRELVRAALASHADPEAWEEAGRLPDALFAALGRSGLAARRWDAGRLGGIGHALATVDEAAQVSASVALGLCIQFEVFCGILLAGRRSEPVRAILDRAIAGTAIGCVGSTEPHGGSSIGTPRTIARRHGDRWGLQGEKWFITNAAIASHAVIAASVVEGDGPPRPTLFLVDLDQAGATRLGSADTVGMRGCDTSGLALDLEIGDEWRLTRPGAGLVVLSRALQMERLLASKQVLAGARQAVHAALAFAQGRVIDAVPLTERQALRHRFADLATAQLSAEALLAVVARGVAEGRSMDREIAALKLHATGTACRSTDEALQVLGARGYTSAFPVERVWRDTRIGRIGGGSDEVMREVIANAVIDGQVPPQGDVPPIFTKEIE